MSSVNRWPLYTPFLIAAVILTVWFVVWRSGADAMRETLAEFAAAEAQSGGAVSYEPLRARGFPFFLRGEIGSLSIERGKWRWQADAVFLHAAPWAPERIVLSSGPSMRIVEPDGQWTILAQGARASIETADSGWLFKAEAAAIVGDKADARVETGRGVINVMPDTQANGAYAVSFRLSDTRLTNARGQTSIKRVDGALSVEPGPRRIRIHGVDSEIGASRVRLSGAVAPDSSGSLEGALAATLGNPAALTDILRIIGVLEPDEARSVEASLALIGAGGGTEIELPLAFSEGKMKLAGVAIGKAPKIGQP